MSNEKNEKKNVLKGETSSSKKTQAEQEGVKFTCKICGESRSIKDMKSATTFFPPVTMCSRCFKKFQ